MLGVPLGNNVREILVGIINLFGKSNTKLKNYIEWNVPMKCPSEKIADAMAKKVYRFLFLSYESEGMYRYFNDIIKNLFVLGQS